MKKERRIKKNTFYAQYLALNWSSIWSQISHIVCKKAQKEKKKLIIFQYWSTPNNVDGKTGEDIISHLKFFNVY